MLRSVYDMAMHDSLDAGFCTVMRVPGGWIYLAAVSAVFVPFHNEFQPREPVDDLPFQGEPA